MELIKITHENLEKEHLAHRLQHSHTFVADNEFHPVQTSAADPLEEADPTDFVLLYPLVPCNI